MPKFRRCQIIGIYLLLFAVCFQTEQSLKLMQPLSFLLALSVTLPVCVSVPLLSCSTFFLSTFPSLFHYLTFFFSFSIHPSLLSLSAVCPLKVCLLLSCFTLVLSFHIAKINIRFVSFYYCYRYACFF